MKDGEEANKEGTEKKSNGVTIDVIPMVIVEVPEEKPALRRGSLRFRGSYYTQSKLSDRIVYQQYSSYCPFIVGLLWDSVLIHRVELIQSAGKSR